MGRKLIDLTGQKFNSLTVLHRTTQEKHPHKTGAGFHVIWTCKCDCGNITYVQGNDLRNGHVKTYGHNSFIDITGQKFNRLTVIKKVDIKEHFYNTDEGSRWLCKCDCGNLTYVRGTDLRSGRIKSCGCLRDEAAITNLKKLHKGPSKGELVIADILTKAKIPFETEKSFNDEKRVQLYRFDFYIPSINSCIEFQGIQHMEFSPFFYKSRSDFLKAQERDRIKISYCLSHGIKLYCIPYWEINNLHNLDDLFNEKFLAHSKFHNDDTYRHQKSKLPK